MWAPVSGKLVWVLWLKIAVVHEVVLWQLAQLESAKAGPAD